MNLMIEMGTSGDIDKLGQLYDDINDYLTGHVNYPGWMKGIYPVREVAAEAVEEGTLYVARAGKEIAGTVILKHDPEFIYPQSDWHVDLDSSEVLMMYTFAVHPRYLRQGVGKGLLEFAIDHGRETGVRAIRLDVHEKNIPAISMYRKYGFEYIDTVDPGYGHPGLDRFELYQKIL